MNKLKITILSLSLITVMAGAAASPALGAIETYFVNINAIYIQMIITIPPLFIVLTSLFFGKISNQFTTKPIAIFGLILYLIGGSFAGITSNIYVLLFFRMILGIGVGLIMPLSIGLISFLYSKNEQSQLMGYSSAMNNLGGIIALVLSGLLVSINWRYGFLVYLLGIFSFILVIYFLPDINLRSPKNKIDKELIKKIAPYAFSVFTIMLIFYALPSNFSIIITKEGKIPTRYIGILMAIQTLGAFLVGIKLDLLIKLFPKQLKYLSGIFLFIGFLLLSITSNIFLLIIALFSIGLGLGTGIPIYNSQASISVLKEETPTAMALMSSMLYLGQFISPFIIQSILNIFHIHALKGPFYITTIISILFLISLMKLSLIMNKENI